MLVLYSNTNTQGTNVSKLVTIYTMLPYKGLHANVRAKYCVGKSHLRIKLGWECHDDYYVSFSEISGMLINSLLL